MVSLIQMEYIVALARYRSFSLAAEKCFVTQPTLSMQIKKVEMDLDVVLFDRTKKPVTPTGIGHILVEQSQRILAETNKIEELISIHKSTLAGELNIGIIPSLAPYLLPHFIGDFAKKYPGLEISVKEMLSDDIMDAIDHHAIDVGILATPLPKIDYNIYPLFYEKVLIYCHENHDFAHLESIEIKQMKNKKIWLMSNGNCFRNQVINLCDLKERKGQTSFEYESASIETLIRLVDSQGGMTLIPELAAQQVVQRKSSSIKPFRHINPVREISIISNRIFIKKRMIEALESEIKNSVRTEMLSNNRGEVVEWN